MKGEDSLIIPMKFESDPLVLVLNYERLQDAIVAGAELRECASIMGTTPGALKARVRIDHRVHWHEWYERYRGIYRAGLRLDARVLAKKNPKMLVYLLEREDRLIDAQPKVITDDVLEASVKVMEISYQEAKQSTGQPLNRRRYQEGTKSRVEKREAVGDKHARGAKR